MAESVGRRQRRYWHKTLRLTLGLLTLWLLVTFGAGYYADELNQWEVFGFPLAFFIFAQGALVVYLAIIAVYVVAMNRIDAEFREAGRAGRKPDA